MLGKCLHFYLLFSDVIMSGLVRCRKEFSLLSQAQKYFSIGSAKFSTDVETEEKVKVPPHRTEQNIARNHTQEHVGKFFNVDPKVSY